MLAASKIVSQLGSSEALIEGSWYYIWGPSRDESEAICLEQKV